MEFKYKVTEFKPETGLTVVKVYTTDFPEGEILNLPLLKSDGTFPTTEVEVRKRIEAAIPVSWFETLKARETKQPDVSHITALVNKEYVCTRTPQEQGVLTNSVGELVVQEEAISK